MGTELLPFSEVAALIATLSALGVILLTPLYLSLRRDVRRLRAWMEQDPDHPRADLAASEALLDRTERELEELYAERGESFAGTEEPVAPTEVQPPGARPAAPPAARVTSERPALERVTMERAALEPHPRWRRFVAEATRPRWLAALALTALVVAAVSIVGVEGVLEGDDAGGPGAADPGGIEVAVLNTTEASGLAGQVSREVERAGFVPGTVETFIREADQSVVMYVGGERRSARRVARELDIGAVQSIDRQAEEAASTADVVVILGEDRVGG